MIELILTFLFYCFFNLLFRGSIYAIAFRFEEDSGTSPAIIHYLCYLYDNVWGSICVRLVFSRVLMALSFCYTSILRY